MAECENSALKRGYLLLGMSIMVLSSNIICLVGIICIYVRLGRSYGIKCVIRMFCVLLVLFITQF